MREIEFRGQRVDTGEWVYGNLVVLQHEDGKAYYIIPFLTNGVIQKELMLKWISPCFEVIPESIGQYTGLNDKNGKKIFEGDILSDGATIWRVEYSETQTGFTAYGVRGNINTYCRYFSLFHLCNGHNQGRELEVIGNIYENQELMGGESEHGKID